MSEQIPKNETLHQYNKNNTFLLYFFSTETFTNSPFVFPYISHYQQNQTFCKISSFFGKISPFFL